MKFSDPINEPPEVQEVRRRLIRHAERLKEFLGMSVISKDIVATEILCIFRCGLSYCGYSFRKILMAWLMDKGSRDCSPCSDCKSFKENRLDDCKFCGKETTCTTVS